MDKLRKYDLHDAIISSLDFYTTLRGKKWLNFNININIVMVLYDGTKINILFYHVKNYKIKIGNKNQYFLEIERYKYKKVDNIEKYDFKIQGGNIDIESKTVKLKVFMNENNKKVNI